MEEDESKSLFALLSSAKRASEACERLSKRGIIDAFDVNGATVALLAGNNIAQNCKQSKAQPVALPTALKNIFEFFLGALPHAQDAFLVVFKFLSSLCDNEALLKQDDVKFLGGQLKGTSLTQGPVVSGDAAADEAVKAKPKIDTRTEVQKLFDRIRVSPRDFPESPKVEQNEKQPSAPDEGGHGTADSFRQIVLSLIKDHDTANVLLSYCLSLPALISVSDDANAFLVLPEAELPTVVKRLQQLKCAVEAASILVNLPSVVASLIPVKLEKLKDLLLNCIRGAVAATVCLSNLPMTKGAAKGTSSEPVPASQESTGAEPTVEVCTSLAELFSKLPSFLPPPCTVASARGLVYEIVTCSLKVWSKLEAEVKESTRIKSGSPVVQNLQTLVVYQILSGVLPLLGVSTRGGETAEGGKSFGHIKFSVPLVELAYQAMQTAVALFEKLPVENEGQETAILSVVSYDIMGSYSTWQCVELLLSHLPFLNIVFSLLFGAFKKTLAAGSLGSGGSTAPIKTRSEKDEQVVQQLMLSMSDRISSPPVKPPTDDESNEKDDDRSKRSSSTSSTVSSSGVVGAEYVIYTDEEYTEGSGDDEQLPLSENAMPPFMAKFFRVPLNAPTPPPPPPPPPPSLSPRKLFSDTSAPPLPPRNLPRKSAAKTSAGAELKKSALHFSLAVISLKFIWSALVQSKHQGVRAFMAKKLQHEHISVLASLLLNTDCSSAQGDSKLKAVSELEQFGAFTGMLTDMVHEMVIGGMIGQDRLQGVLLHELGLNHKCWPLNLSPSILSLLARVLICRLQYQSTHPTQSCDDTLTLSIWKGFLHSLEENATSEEESDEDPSVAVIQLLLFVWHSFSEGTRKSLLLQCARALVNIADERQSTAVVCPLPVGRLLLILDYMLFHFSDPVPQLTEQVNHNVFSMLQERETPQPHPEGSSQPPPTSTGAQPFHYPCWIQTQYSNTLLKMLKKEPSGKDQVGLKFYNLRPFPGETWKAEKVTDDVPVDQEACQVLLTLKIHEGTVGYDTLWQALASLVGFGLEPRQHNTKPHNMLIDACASHQNFLLVMNLLNHLPPSQLILRAMVDGAGLSFKDSGAASLLIFALYLNVKMKVVRVDPDELMDTVVMVGVPPEEAEELLARVVSVIDAGSHVLVQGVPLLEELTSSEGGDRMSLVSIVAADFLLCNITQALIAEQQQQLCGTAGDSDGSPPPQPDNKVASPQAKEAIYSRFSQPLLPTVLKAVHKLLKCSHAHVLNSEAELPIRPLVSSVPPSDLEGFLAVAGKNPLQAKEAKPLFQSLFPEDVKERIAEWNSAAVMDREQKEKLWSQSSDCMLPFLSNHLASFSSGTTTAFDPTSSLKNALSSALQLLSVMLDPCPARCVQIMGDLVAISSSGVLEFVQPELAKLATMCGAKAFSQAFTNHQMVNCYKLATCRTVKDYSFLGVVLGEIFLWLGAMLENSEVVWPSQEESGSPIDMIELVLLAASPSCTTHGLLESVKFLSKLVQQATKASPVPEGSGQSILTRQLECISRVQPAKMQDWLRRLVIGLPSDGTAEVAACTQQLYNFLEQLTKEDCKWSTAVDSFLLSSMLPLGAELLEALHGNSNLIPNFKHYFTGLVHLAGSSKNEGHLLLVSSVASWLKLCASFAGSKPANVEEKQDPLVPATYLLQYLAHLTTAVQFSTNRARCSERISLANEGDILVQELESEDDAEGMLMGEEFQGDEREGDESLNNKLCTFTTTQRSFMNQHWYHCHTCKLVDGSGMCSICAKVCHKGHDVTYSKFGSFFCDCGAKEDKSCKSLVKRTGKAEDDKLPAAADVREKVLFDSKKKRRKRRHRKLAAEKGGDASAGAKGSRKSERRSSFPSLTVMKMVRQIEKYKTKLRSYLDSCAVVDSALQLVGHIVPAITSQAASVVGSGPSKAQQALMDLHTSAKEIELTDSLVVATLGSQEGPFENVRLNLNGDQGQILKQLVTSNAIRRVAMCSLSSIKGKKQHITVNHDKGKLTFLQLFPIQSDSNRKKLTLTRLGTASVNFTIISLSSNPFNEDYLAVCGLKECQVLSVSATGQVVDKINVHASVESSGYIVKATWVPGSQTELVIAANTFVKVYDLGRDALSPMYYFIVLSGKIKDVTVAVNEEGKFLIVMVSTGEMYSQPLIPACSAADGPVYFTIDLPVTHPSIEVAEGQTCGGGASVYYSHCLQLLFFSYNNGKSFAASLTKSCNKILHVFEILQKSNGASAADKTSGSPLTQWTEVNNHPGLICALSQNTSNPCVLMVKPNCIQVHELKAPPNKAKVQGMVALRQPPAGGDPSAQPRTTLIILCEDGTLRIYVTNNNSSSQFWLQPDFQPTSPLSVLRSVGKKVRPAQHGTEAPKFPVDFFENCQMIQYTDIDFVGSDILHVYQKQQIKHRFNTAGLYIANTKPGGFTVEVVNHTHATVVMVGVRISIGNRSQERIPSTIDVFGRVHPVTLAGAARWIDIPFTREESLQADKSVKIKFGPSADPSGISLVDCIKVYGKTKDVFGWPENNGPEPTAAPTKAQADGGKGVAAAGGAGSTGDSSKPEELQEYQPHVSAARHLSVMDKLVCNAFGVLGNYCLSAAQPKLQEVSQVVSKASPLLISNSPVKLLSSLKFLLASTVETKEDYHKHKDQIQLTHVVTLLSANKDTMEPDVYQRLLLTLLTIARSRPENLELVFSKDACKQQQKVVADAAASTDGVASTEGHVSMEEFVALLNSVFWKFYALKPKNIGVVPLISPGLIYVDTTVEVLTELMWTLLQQHPTLLPVVTPHVVKMLLFSDTQVSNSCMKALVRLTKPHRRKSRRQGSEPLQADRDEVGDTMGGDSFCNEETEDGGGEQEEEGEEEEQPPQEVKDGEQPQDGEQPPREVGEGQPPPQDKGQAQNGGERTGEGEQPAPPAVAVGSGDAAQQPQPPQQRRSRAESDQRPPQQRMSIEELLSNPGDAMDQFLANPSQYMMALQGLLPDDEAMMNLAIALSLHEGGEGGNQGARQALEAVFEGLGLPNASEAQASQGGGEGEQGGEGENTGGSGGEGEQERQEREEREEREQQEQEEDAYEQMLLENAGADSNAVPEDVVPDAEGQPPTPPQQLQQEGGGGDGGNNPHRSRHSHTIKDEGNDDTSSSSRSTPAPEDVGRAAGGGGGSAAQGTSRDHTSNDPAADPSSSARTKESAGPDANSEESSAEDEPSICLDESSLVDSEQWLKQAEEGGDGVEATPKPLPQPLQLLQALLKHLPEVEQAGGVRAIPFMQLVYSLTTHLENSAVDRSVLHFVLKIFISRLNFDVENVNAVVERSTPNEVHLLYLRFFNLLMTRKHKQVKISDGNCVRLATAHILLKDSKCLAFCLKVLKALIVKSQCLEAIEANAVVVTTLLKPHVVSQPADMVPFLQSSYVKEHANDIFEAYAKLLAEMVLVLPTQFKKMSDAVRWLPDPYFGQEWMDSLCEYMLKVSKSAGVGRKHVRKLLLLICGTKEKYRLVRSIFTLRSHMQEFRKSCKNSGFDPSQTPGPFSIPYDTMRTLIDHLRSCNELATARTSNWQVFCLEEKSTVAYLLQASLSLDEGLAHLLLQLMNMAVSGAPPKSSSTEPDSQRDQDDGEAKEQTKDDKQSSKSDKKHQGGKGSSEDVKSQSPPANEGTGAPNREACRAVVQLFLMQVDDSCISRFIRQYLLLSNLTPLRWLAHTFYHCLFQYADPDQQESLVRLLWQQWPTMSSCGHKAAQFVDLLGFLTISAPQVLAKEALCKSYTEKTIAVLKRQNELVGNHPNCHMYNQLQGLVDFDGFYLESEPCLVCNDPEVPFSVMKLGSIKSEIRYSPTQIFVKLVGSYTLSQVTLRVADIKRTKMVRTVNLYYSNRTVLNVIELKNNRHLWLKARSCTLAPNQSEVKMEFHLPIVACNIILEFADFYDNIQGGSETLQCPRCQASVPANPGVCGTCGENVYQCHKCRAINYDERDPFMCNSCGYSKYAKFEVAVEGRPCSAVDPIESEEDRKKTLSNINGLLDRADQVYKMLVNYRNELDVALVSLASGAPLVYQSAKAAHAGSETAGVNRGIQLVAHRYCVECKGIYQELSKIIQGVSASRKELVKYDQRKLKHSSAIPAELSESPPSTSQLATSPVSKESGGGTWDDAQDTQGVCYGCISASTEHCITLLRALSMRSETRRHLVEQNLIQELVEFNLRNGSTQVQPSVRKLLCHLTRDDLAASTKLNEFVLQRVLEQISNPRISLNLASVVRPEIMLLTDSLKMEDLCWEQRLRTVLRLFCKARSNLNPAVTSAVTMPCLRILQSIISPPDLKGTEGKSVLAISGLPALAEQVQADSSAWLRDDPNASYRMWCQVVEKRVSSGPSAMTKEELYKYRLMEKFAGVWKSHVKKVPQHLTSLHQASWLRSMLFNPSSQSARKTACTLISSLCTGEARHRQVLNLLCSFLPAVSTAGEHAQEYLELFRTLMEDPAGQWKSYLALRGALPKIGALIDKEIAHLLELEETTLNSGLSQGYALKMLTELLKSFLKVDRIKERFKSKLVGMVLNGYLSLKRLVVQRTKRVDDTQDLLLEMLENLTSGTEQEKQEFMAICVETLKRFKMSDVLTPIFVFERLCNIIRPEQNDVGDFFLSLEKDPQQEEFLQGRMQGNPYPSTTPGLGPLMREVKNKICTDCEMISLIEDDTGMELLVCNKIISLDLPVKEVYKKIWCTQPDHGETMRVIYRMRGLLGDATEEFVEQLSSGKDEDVDEEKEYKMAEVLSRCGGLDAILSRLSHVQDFVHGHNLILAALKLLGFCVKLKVNRQYVVQPHLKTLDILLKTLNMALHFEEEVKNGMGAAVAEKVLQVTESILHEVSSTQQVLVRSISQEQPSDLTEAEGEESRLSTLLKHMNSPFVQSDLGVREGLMHIIPFLTFGDPRTMTTLLKTFSPYLNFETFDKDHSPEEALYLDCFCVVANRIGNDASGEKLKDLAIEMGLTTSAVAYLEGKVPTKSEMFDTPEWKEFISLPSVPYVIKILTGLCRNHTKTQLAVCQVIPQLHLLEQVASAEHIGTTAENLLEAMMTHPDCEAKIKEVRLATKVEKRSKAMALRAKELGALGMQVNEKGQVIPASVMMKEIEAQIVEETGLRCCICLEGYKNQPSKVLGIYTYTRKVTLDEFENKPRKTMGYCTVSHFNVVHFECHSAAVKLARSRDEWESAMLQNANTKCNGLMPVWGPDVSDSAFASCLARHTNYLQECTGLFEPSFHLLAHDLRLLIVRFAYEKSFSAESGGGGPQSNLYLVPYLFHTALYILNTTRGFQREERVLSTFLSATPDKWISSSYELDGPLYAVVLSLFVQTLQQWEQNKLSFLRRLLVLVHVRNISPSPIKSLPSSDPAEYSVYKPALILFGLVDQLQQILKKPLKETESEIGQSLLDYIRSNDVTIQEGCDKVLATYQEEFLPVESFEEFFDVLGLLAEVQSPSSFLKEQLTCLA